MAMNAGSAAVAGRRRHRRRPVMAEINVTPMVDVMLVLLIIFMVSAPLLTVGVPLDLPQTQAKSLDQDKEPLTVSVNVKGEVYLQNTEIAVEELVPKLKAITEARGGAEERIFVRGRPAGRLRDGDEGDGANIGGRFPPRGIGDGDRAGVGALKALFGNEDGLFHIGDRARGDIAVEHVVACGQAAGGAAERGPAGRSRDRLRVHQDDGGKQDRPESRSSKAAGRKDRRSRAGRGRDRQARREERGQGRP